MALYFAFVTSLSIIYGVGLARSFGSYTKLVPTHMAEYTVSDVRMNYWNFWDVITGAYIHVR
jgi:hypothetical protein